MNDRRRLDEAAVRDQVVLHAAVTLNHISHTLDYARQAMGMAFAPRRAVRDELVAGLLVAIPISKSLLSGTMTSLCRHGSRPLSRAADAFLAVLKDELLQDESLPKAHLARSN